LHNTLVLEPVLPKRAGEVKGMEEAVTSAVHKKGRIFLHVSQAWIWHWLECHFSQERALD
jgi:hypothetical protein